MRGLISSVPTGILPSPARPVHLPRETQMAPDIRSHRKSRGAKHSVHPQYWTDDALCQVTWGDYLCVVSPTEPNPPQVGRMDSTGFEPASATWTECYVPVTPRALY